MNMKLFLILVSILFCLTFDSVMFFSALLFFFAILVSLKLFCISNLWYSMIFFFIFISGLLVLMFYVVSADFNPMLYKKKMKFLFFFSLVFFTPKFYSNYFYKFNTSKKIFCLQEFFSIFVFVVVILFMIWMVTKMIFSKKGNFRPIF